MRPETSVRCLREFDPSRSRGGQPSCRRPVSVGGCRIKTLEANPVSEGDNSVLDGPSRFRWGARDANEHPSDLRVAGHPVSMGGGTPARRVGQPRPPVSMGGPRATRLIVFRRIASRPAVPFRWGSGRTTGGSRTWLGGAKRFADHRVAGHPVSMGGGEWGGRGPRLAKPVVTLWSLPRVALRMSTPRVLAGVKVG